MNTMRAEAERYLRVARGGLAKPEKFNAVSLFHLTALAIEGYWIGWLEDNGGAPAHHGFRDLVRTAEARTPVPRDLKRDLLGLDQYQRLCDWIPLEPRQPTWEEIPGLLDLAVRVAEFTRPGNLEGETS